MWGWLFLQHCCNAKSTLHNLVPFFPSSFQPTKAFISLATQLCLLLPLVKHYITSVSSASLQPPYLDCISTSALNLHWMQQLLWGKLWGFMTWPHPLTSELSMLIALWPQNAPPDQQILYCNRNDALQGERGDFNKPVCTYNMRSGPASADQTRSTASQGS